MKNYKKLIVDKINKLDELASQVWNSSETKTQIKEKHKKLLAEFDRNLYDFENNPAGWDFYVKNKGNDYESEIEACHSRMRTHIRLWGDSYKMYGG